MSAALSAVDARRATANVLTSLADTLDREARIRVVAAGKAAVGMALAADDYLGARRAASVMTADADVQVGSGWRAIAGTHPEPSAGSEAAGRAALALADAARQHGELLLVCLSGGASAMLAVPAPGLTIDDKTATTRVLLKAGLDIGELNLVRRQLSAIKGGRLAARAGRSVTLAISDVCTPIEDDPRVIGSGPTAGDDSTFAMALDVLTRHDVLDRVPRVVREYLERGVATGANAVVAPDDERLRNAAYWIAASRHDAMRVAGDAARALGYHVHTVTTPTIGTARDAARELMDIVGFATRPACVIASGETTVRVTGNGRGGRNQELAVAALERLSLLAPAALASIGTDGRDGPTDAAGAFVDGEMWAALGATASDRVRAALEDNDTYPLLEGLDALIRTGPSGTNVGDLQVILLPSS